MKQAIPRAWIEAADSPAFIDPAYLPQTPVETLKSRLEAVSVLNSSDRELARKAELFIRQTSTDQDADLQRLQALAARVRRWLELEICSVYENHLGSFLEYKIRLESDQGEELIHRHARYTFEPGYCRYVSQTAPLIRLIGDPVLHRPAKLFPQKPSVEEIQELDRQIALAKDVLIATGGAGIAANQCAAIVDPFQFTIVGVFKDSPAHLQAVARRYPMVDFPDARILLNPKIVSYSEIGQCFSHACLSIPSPNRCELRSPEWIEIQYLDPTANRQSLSQTLKGTDAVVLWHELMHILEGKTYMELAIDTLSSNDRRLVAKMLAEESARRTVASDIPNLTVPPFYFTIRQDSEGKSQLDSHKLLEVLPKFNNETLAGIQQRSKLLSQIVAEDVEDCPPMLLSRMGQFASPSAETNESVDSQNGSGLKQ